MSISTVAAVVHEPKGEFALEAIRLADLQPDEALIKVEACGICHMDIEAKEMMDLPCIMGHEGAGVIIETGSAVSEVQVGDRVIAGYGFCGSCRQCSADRPYFCEQSWESAFSGKRLDGSSTATDEAGSTVSAAFFQQSTFARHAIVQARSLVKLADDVPWQVAAALPCGFLTGAGSATNLLHVDPDSSFLVLGVGAVGIGAIVGAKMAGCKTIVAVDIRDNRLELAREFGAAHTINGLEVDLDEWSNSNCPTGFTHVLETTGNKEVFAGGCRSLAVGGSMAYAILPAPMEEFEFKPFELFTKGAVLKAVSFGSAVPSVLVSKMIEWWSNGSFPVEKLIQTFDFEDINTAVAASDSGEVVKPVLLMN